MPDWQEQAAGVPHVQERAIAPIRPRPAMLAVVRDRSDLRLGRRPSRWHRRACRANDSGHAALVDKVRIAKDERPPMPDRGMPERDTIRMKPHRFSSLFEHDLPRNCVAAASRAKSRPLPVTRMRAGFSGSSARGGLASPRGNSTSRHTCQGREGAGRTAQAVSKAI